MKQSIRNFSHSIKTGAEFHPAKTNKKYANENNV